MKTHIAGSLLALSTTLLSANTYAADFNYNAIQVSYDDISLDFPGVPSLDGDGFSFAGALEITPDVYIKGNIGMWDVDFGIDIDQLEIGAGYHMPLNQKTDGVFEFSMGNLEIGSLDVDTWTLSAGARHQLDNKLELGGTIGLTDYDGDETEIFLSFNALYSLQKDVAGIFEFTTEDNITSLSFGARFYFK